MRDAVVRRIIWAVIIGVGWGVLSTALGIGWGWWLLGLIAMDAVLAFASRRAQKPKHARRRRVGPPLEWID